MGFSIEDGEGTSQQAGVSNEAQLKTVSEIHFLQHHISRHKGRVYQTEGNHILNGLGTKTILHLQNTSTTLRMGLTYIRVQAASLASGVAVPSSGTYFQTGFGTTYTSGGTSITPINMNRDSANEAEATVYDNNPTVGGTFIQIDKWYPDTNMLTYRKHGSIILGQNDTFEVRLVTNHGSGIAYARTTFVYF